MALALLIRLARRLRKLFKRQPSPPAPMARALDLDRLSEDLKDPWLRNAYIDYLETCLTMPGSRYIR